MKFLGDVGVSISTLKALREGAYQVLLSSVFTIKPRRMLRKGFFDLLSIETPRLETGVLIIIEESRYRVRPLPILPA